MAFIGSILTTGSFTGAQKQIATLKSSGGGGGAGAYQRHEVGRVTGPKGVERGEQLVLYSAVCGEMPQCGRRLGSSERWASRGKSHCGKYCSPSLLPSDRPSVRRGNRLLKNNQLLLPPGEIERCKCS